MASIASICTAGKGGKVKKERRGMTYCIEHFFLGDDPSSSILRSFSLRKLALRRVLWLREKGLKFPLDESFLEKFSKRTPKYILDEFDSLVDDSLVEEKEDS